MPLAAVGAVMYMQAEQEVKQSKDWRQRLDVILQEMKAQQTKEGRGEKTRHLSLSITHLEDTIMRQGMRLKAIAEEFPEVAAKPYPTSYDPSSPTVEPPADGLKM